MKNKRIKIKLIPELKLPQKLVNSDELYPLFSSFYSYCSTEIFHYPVVPRMGEMIDIEDIMWEWAEKFFSDTKNEVLNKLWGKIENELIVTEILHTRKYILITCSDEY